MFWHAARVCAALVHGSRSPPRGVGVPAAARLDRGMKSRVHPKYKTRYRVGNWRVYERTLVRRGDVTLWLSPDALAAWGMPPSGDLAGGSASRISRSRRRSCSASSFACRCARRRASTGGS